MNTSRRDGAFNPLGFGGGIGVARDWKLRDRGGQTGGDRGAIGGGVFMCLLLLKSATSGEITPGAITLAFERILSFGPSSSLFVSRTAALRLPPLAAVRRWRYSATRSGGWPLIGAEFSTSFR